MKKFISLITVISMLFSLIFTASATTSEQDVILFNDSELDLTQYTLDDIWEMSTEEFNTLIADFERVYDPFGSYARRQELNEENTVSPRWTSGDDEEDGTHAGITAQACSVLMNDIGFFANNMTDKLNALLCISLASNLPDDDETDLGTFAGHFYDPVTEENYLGSSSNTAKTNAVVHYQNAYTAAEGGDIMTMYEELGRALHYIQDANVPYHAANVVSLGALSDHTRFENFAEINLSTYIEDLTTLASSNYTTVANEYVRDLVKIAATDAKSKYAVLENSEPESTDWNTIARFCTRKSVKYSTIIMYKLAQKSGVPFYYN